MPAHKKDPSTRARRNKAATAAKLKAAPDYSEWTLAELRAEIDERNAEDGHGTKIPKRGNADTLRAALVADDMQIPDLPDRIEGWHSMTRAMWEDIWTSPMSREWDGSDLHNVYVLVAIYDDMWTAPTAKERKEAAGEYRLQRAELGLSPYSRRRLEWQIETTEEAKERGQSRRQRRGDKPQPAGQGDKPDPRALHAV